MSSLIGYTRLHVRALQRRAVLDQRHRRFAVGTRENLEQFRVDGHAAEYMTPSGFCGTIHVMKARSCSSRRAARRRPSRSAGSGAQVRAAARRAAARRTARQVADAYDQFLLGHHSKRRQRSTTRSPRTSARWRSIRTPPTFRRSSPASTCEQNKVQEAMAAAEQALKIAPANREAQPRARHDLRGAGGEQPGRGARPRRRSTRPTANARQGDPPSRGGDRRAGRRSRSERARDARAPVHAQRAPSTKAIPLLTDAREPGAAAGRTVR